jgi:hypothetical protein
MLMKIEKDTYMMNDSKDLLAKLLATENITVVRGNASTASFNVETRVLTLPLWKDMTIEQEEMLIGHEVGHALYTTNAYAEDLKSSRALMSYMNVIEDVRIEKLIKKKYPGLKKSFTSAYKQLQENDFFGVGDKDLTKLLFIDRANLYFKAGFNCGVKFTTEETVWLKKIDSCDTMKDVYDLAVELLGWTREERQKQKDLLAAKVAQMGDQFEEQDEQDDEGFDDSTDLFDDLEEEESDADGDSNEDGDENGSTENDSNDKSEEDSTSELKASETNEPSEGVSAAGDITTGKTIVKEEEVLDDCESITDHNLNKNLAEKADTSIVYENIEYKDSAVLMNPVVDYKTVLKELKYEYAHSWKTQDYSDFFTSREKDADKFLNDCKNEVAYLVKEFEMKKQAARYARAQSSKSGEIEVKKLYAYKLKEDLFKRVTTLPDGKNHGMIMLIDWSGSMNPTMYDTLKQTVILAMFCAKIQIPYKVFAFTNGRSYSEEQYKVISDKREDLYAKSKTEAVLILDSFHMIEFFSNEMRANEFKEMARLVLIGPFNYARQYGLHSTPLNEALWFINSYMGKFIKENNIQIPTFITLTDGEGHSFQAYSPVYRDENGERKDVKFILVDPLTKNSYRNFRYGSDQTKALLKMLKDRFNCNVVGFHIIRNNRREMYSFIRSNAEDRSSKDYFHTEQMIADLRSSFRNDGFMNVKSSYRDALFVIPSNKLKIEDGDLEVSGKMTSNQIARKFTKHLDTRKTSKVLLNQFVRMVA